MRTRAAVDLINDVRVRSDQVTSNGAVAFIDDNTILEWLNQAWAELYDHLIQSGEHYYLKQDNFITSTADLYPLPTDHYKTMGVSVQSNGFFFPISRFQFQQRDGYQPLIIAGTPVRHFYYPVAARMTLNDGGTPAGSNSFIDGVNGWEVFCVDTAAKKCAERDENTDLAGMLAGSIGAALQRIMTMSSSRNPGEAPKTRIFRGRRGGMWGDRMGYDAIAFNPGAGPAFPTAMKYDLWGSNMKLISGVSAVGPAY